MSQLPNWVWDLVADLLDEEEAHPKLYFTSGAFEGYRQYDWCPQVALTRVPDEVRSAANVLRAYRQTETPSEDATDPDSENDAE